MLVRRCKGMRDGGGTMPGVRRGYMASAARLREKWGTFLVDFVNRVVESMSVISSNGRNDAR